MVSAVTFSVSRPHRQDLVSSIIVFYFFGTEASSLKPMLELRGD